MRFYTSDGCTYEGMDEATVRRLRLELGRETVLVTKESYEEILAARGV